MADTSAPNPPPAPDRFPLVTVGVAGGALFAFLFLMWLARAVPGGDGTGSGAAGAEPRPGAAPKLDEIRERNENALNGVGATMSRARAREKLLGTLKGPDDTMPFPTPPPPAPPGKNEPAKGDQK
jgi:hypothetical protein